MPLGDSRGARKLGLLRSFLAKLTAKHFRMTVFGFLFSFHKVIWISVSYKSNYYLTTLRWLECVHYGNDVSLRHPRPHAAPKMQSSWVLATLSPCQHVGEIKAAAAGFGLPAGVRTFPPPDMCPLVTVYRERVYGSYIRAFQFGQKKFRFDSIRQSDKFAACTLIFK